MESEKFVELISREFKKAFPSLSYQQLLQMAEYAEIQQIPKKTEIIKMGQNYGKIVFVLSGLFRAYYKYEETENTFWFREQCTVFASHKSILANKPSTISYQALEDSVVVVIDYAILKELANKNSESAKNIIIVLEDLVLELIDRIEDFVTLNPESRYENFIERHANIVNRIPQQYIASYIGITPESFSRLKNRKMNK